LARMWRAKHLTSFASVSSCTVYIPKISTHKVNIYKEYHSVCPLVGTGTLPSPSFASECVPPPGTKGGGAHSPAGKGLGESQFRRLEKGLALCLLCVSMVHAENPGEDSYFLYFNFLMLLTYEDSLAPLVTQTVLYYRPSPCPPPPRPFSQLHTHNAR
jgi:hypothetical protein